MGARPKAGLTIQGPWCRAIVAAQFEAERDFNGGERRRVGKGDPNRGYYSHTTRQKNCYLRRGLTVKRTPWRRGARQAEDASMIHMHLRGGRGPRITRKATGDGSMIKLGLREKKASTTHAGRRESIGNAPKRHVRQ